MSINFFPATNHGTTHIFPITPYGGAITMRTHGGRFVNVIDIYQLYCYRNVYCSERVVFCDQLVLLTPTLNHRRHQAPVVVVVLRQQVQIYHHRRLAQYAAHN
jgi:hypothetical protein